MVPVSWLSVISSQLRFNRLPMEGGMTPLNLLQFRDLQRIEVESHILYTGEILNENNLEHIYQLFHQKIKKNFNPYNMTRFVKDPIVSGIGPEKLQPIRILQEGKRSWIVTTYKDHNTEAILAKINQNFLTILLASSNSQLMMEYVLLAPCCKIDP